MRDEQPREMTRRQIALAIRDEVADLEQAGIYVIQIDEQALREGPPLRERDWEQALALAVDDFRWRPLRPSRKPWRPCATWSPPPGAYAKPCTFNPA